MADPSAEKSSSDAQEALKQAKETVAAAVEEAKPENLAEKVLPEAQKTLDNLLSRGLEGAKSILQNIEEHKQDISSKLLGAASSLTHASGGGASGIADSEATTAPAPKEGEKPRELPEPTENQPLVPSGQRGIETASWKNCCGILDCLQSSDR